MTENEQLLEQEIKNNLELIAIDPKNFLLMHQSLKDSYDFTMKAVAENGMVLEYVNEDYKNHAQIVRQAVYMDILALPFASNELKLDKKFLKTIHDIYKDTILYYVHEQLGNDKEFCLKYVKRNGIMVQYVSETLKQDKDIVLAALTQNEDSYEFLDKQYLKDRQFVLSLMSRNPKVLKYVPEEFTKDKVLVLAAMKKNWKSLEFASKELTHNKDFILEAININSSCIHWTSETLKNDPEIYMQAVTRKGLAFYYLLENLKNNKEIAKTALNQNVNTYEILPKHLKEDDELIEIVLDKTKDGFSLLPYSKRSNREYALKAISKRGLALQHVADNLTNDKQLVWVALKNNKKSQTFIGKELKKEIGKDDPLVYLDRYFFHERLQESIPDKNSVNNKKIKI